MSAPTAGLGARYAVGAKHTLPPVSADPADMIRFAELFDPQQIHLSEEAAVAKGFPGLVASGWYVCGLFMRQFVTHVINGSSALVSPGVETIRWMNPLIAGATLSGVATVARVIPSFSVPGGSIATFDVVLRTDGALRADGPSGEEIATLSMHCLFERSKEEVS